VIRTPSPPAALSTVIQELAAIRGFVTSAELQAAGCVRSDLPELRQVPGSDGLFEFEPGSEQPTPGEGTAPLLEALDRHSDEEFDRDLRQNQLVELELWEALALCTALGSRHGAQIVRAYNQQAAQKDRFPHALQRDMVHFAALLEEGDGASRQSRVASRLLDLLRDERRGAPRIVRCRVLAFLRKQWLPATEETLPDPCWARFAQFIGSYDETRAVIWESNLRIAMWGAKEHAPRSRSPARLFLAASCGLNRALDSFEQNRGYALSTYARYWLRIMVDREALETRSALRMAGYLKEEASKQLRAAYDFELREGHPPSNEELAAVLDTDRATVERRIGLLRWPLPHDLRMAADGTLPADLALRREQATLAEVAWWQRSFERLEQAFEEKLKPRQKFVIQRRFGLDGEEIDTLSQVGRALDLSRERVRQIEREALARIAPCLDAITADWQQLYSWLPAPSTPPTS